MWKAALEMIREEWRSERPNPWLVRYSGGKDSSALLQAIVSVVSKLPRTRRLIVSTSDTKVENPVMQRHVDAQWAKIQKSLPSVMPEIILIKTIPDVKETFWSLMLGKGYPVPSRAFRWCTDRLKLRPSWRLDTHYPDAISVIGTRGDESTNRSASFANAQREGNLLLREGRLTFAPLEHISTDDIWSYLLQNPPPWGGSNRDLITLYKNATGECPVVLSRADSPSCGSKSARFGCWTCTVVEKDRSLGALASQDETDQLDLLIDFRERLKQASAEERQSIRRNGQPGVGPIKLETRKALLQELLSIQEATGFELISEAEIEYIKSLWEKDATVLFLTEDEKRREDLTLTYLPVQQGETTHYLTTLPFIDVVRVAEVMEERPAAELRYQRDVNWTRAGKLAEYVLKNPSTFILPPIHIAVEGAVVSSGTLTIPRDAKVRISDGQHRRAAIERVLERDRSFEFSEIGVVVTLLDSVATVRQHFADLNMGKPIERSVRSFMDARNASAAKQAMEVAPFLGRIDPVKSSISKHSPFLWTLSALEQTFEVEDHAWWEAALQGLPGLQQLLDGKLTASLARTRYVWAHGVGLRGIGEAKRQGVDATLLQKVNWSREAPEWEGVAFHKKRMLANNAKQVGAEIVRQVQEKFEV